jgi:4-amino-4-deoxy-L-arabinose transferase-like glycosyltransferase
MIEGVQPAPRVSASATSRLGHWWLSLVVLIVALLPRILNLGSFVTVDEGFHWFQRTAVFVEALRTGDWAATQIVGHPGVTTLWLGSSGRLLFETLVAQGLVRPDNEPLLRMLLQLPLGIITSLIILVCFWLLKRLLDPNVALLAAFLWATEPFLVAHSRLLHLDALLSSLMLLSLLAAMVGLTERSWSIWLLSALGAGLALLTKSPSILLIPLVGALALLAAVYQTGFSQAKTLAGFRQIMWLSGRWLLMWGLVAALVFFALWPAMWVDPLRALGVIIHQARSDGGSPHAWGNYFLGQPVADPGPWFYPVVLLARLTPWTLFGALVGIGLIIWRVRQRRWTTELAVLAVFCGFVVLFSIALSSGPKKFDRYLLPVFPALNLIAAAGWGWLAALLVHRWRQTIAVGWGLTLLVFGGNLLWYHPHALSYYSPLVGGGSGAAQLIPIGWGEGYEQVGAYINQRSDGQDYPVAAYYPNSLAPFVATPVVPLSWVLTPGKAGYAVLYIDQVQRNDEAEATRLLRSNYQPTEIINIHGIPYAEIYQLPRPVAVAREAQFGTGIALRGYDLDLSAMQSSRVITLTTHWQALAAMPTDYTLFVHVLNPAGDKIGQADVPPGGPRDPTTSWQVGQYVSAVHQIPIWGEPTQPLWLALGIYPPPNGARLPLSASPPPAGAPNAGEHALLIGPLR